MLALKKILDTPDFFTSKTKLYLGTAKNNILSWNTTNMTFVWASFAATAGMALLFAIMPSVFFPDYISASEMEQMRQIPAEYLNPLISNLRDVRISIFTADCWRTFFVVAVGTAVLLLLRYKEAAAEVGCRCHHRALPRGYVAGQQALPQRRDVCGAQRA